MKARTSINLRSLYSFKRGLLAILIINCAIFPSTAQLNVEVLNASHSKLRPVKLGDPVPDIEFPITNLKNTTAKFSDFRGKLVILNIWGIGCISCFLTLPVIDSLERIFRDKVQFISVNKDSKEDMAAYLKTKKMSWFERIPTVYNDRALAELFPHDRIQVIIWIDKNGILRGKTHAQHITEENIRALLNNEKGDWPDSVTEYKPEAPLLSQKSSTEKNRPLYYSAVLPYRNDYNDAIGFFYDKKSKTVRFFVVNYRIHHFYSNALRRVGVKQDWRKILLEVRDSTRFFYNNQSYKYNYQWIEENSYCYEAVFPIQTPKEEIWKLMLANVEQYFQIKGSLETRKLKSWILIDKKTTGRHQIQSMPAIRRDSFPNVKALVDFLDMTLFPFFSEAKKNLGRPIRVTAKALSDINLLRKELAVYNYEIIEGYRDVKVFVIKDAE